MYWTILIIHYTSGVAGVGTGPQGHLQTHLVYASMRECGTAMNHVMDAVRIVHRDAWAQCDETRSISISDAPQKRPNEAND